MEYLRREDIFGSHEAQNKSTVPGPQKKKTRKTNSRFRQKLVRKTKTTGHQKLEARKTKTTLAQKLKVSSPPENINLDKSSILFSVFSFHCSNEIEREINGGHTKTKGKDMKWIGRQRKSKEMKENEQKMLVRKNKNNDGSKVRS